MMLFLCGALFLNALAFTLYGIDKWRAVRHKWRISEKALLSISLFSGVFGSLLGMIVFHHKIRKWYFWVIHIFSLGVWVNIVYQVWWKSFTFL